MAAVAAVGTVAVARLPASSLSVHCSFSGFDNAQGELLTSARSSSSSAIVRAASASLADLSVSTCHDTEGCALIGCECSARCKHSAYCIVTFQSTRNPSTPAAAVHRLWTAGLPRLPPGQQTAAAAAWTGLPRLPSLPAPWHGQVSALDRMCQSLAITRSTS